MSELSSLSVAQQRELLASKQVTSRELVDGALARIEQVQPYLNCFVEYGPTKPANERSLSTVRSVDLPAFLSPSRTRRRGSDIVQHQVRESLNTMSLATPMW